MWLYYPAESYAFRNKSSKPSVNTFRYFGVSRPPIHSLLCIQIYDVLVAGNGVYEGSNSRFEGSG